MPITPKTEEQVKAQAALLSEMKPRIRRYSFFGDDNWAKIDVQIKVLEEDMSEDELNDYVDEQQGELDLTDDQKYELSSVGFEAIDWRDGTLDEPPSDGWKSLLPHDEPKTEAKPAKKAVKKAKKTTKKKR
jgi:hypothetical protein